eukprot:2349041-Pleurochrysis_carterae.AAC.1
MAHGRDHRHHHRPARRYVPDLDRVVLRDKVLERVFANASSARKTAVTTCDAAAPVSYTHLRAHETDSYL